MGHTDEVFANPLRENVSVADFYIGKYEVSEGLWKKVMGENYSIKGRDRYPVYNVTYEKACQFVTALNKKTGMNFSLPTDAQWEYAARDGKHDEGNPYSCGGDSGHVIWDRDEPVNVNEGCVNKYLGLHNMSGNVEEWCVGYFSEKDPDKHIRRGGSYYSCEDYDINVYSRQPGGKGDQGYVGLRLVYNIQK